MAARFGDLRSELMLTFPLSLRAATILAIGSAIYISRLERETRLRYDQVAAGRIEMGKLSQRLVAAQEQERKNISRELHDEVGQTLNALLVDAGNLQKRIPESDTQSRELLDSIRRLADTSVNEVRDIALLLRPSMLDDLGLTAAIQWQAREVSRRTGLAAGRQPRRTGGAAKRCAPCAGQDRSDRTETESRQPGAECAGRRNRI